MEEDGAGAAVVAGGEALEEQADEAERRRGRGLEPVEHATEPGVPAAGRLGAGEAHLTRVVDRDGRRAPGDCAVKAVVGARRADGGGGIVVQTDRQAGAVAARGPRHGGRHPAGGRSATVRLAAADGGEHRRERQLPAGAREVGEAREDAAVAGEELAQHEAAVLLEREPGAGALEVARGRHRGVAGVARVVGGAARLVDGAEARADGGQRARDRVHVRGEELGVEQAGVLEPALAAAGVARAPAGVRRRQRDVGEVDSAAGRDGGAEAVLGGGAETARARVVAVQGQAVVVDLGDDVRDAVLLAVRAVEDAVDLRAAALGARPLDNR
jgi:hypothetical protein